MILCKPEANALGSVAALSRRVTVEMRSWCVDDNAPLILHEGSALQQFCPAIGTAPLRLVKALREKKIRTVVQPITVIIGDLINFEG